MNNQELKELIWSRQFTDEEISEAKRIVDILRQEGFDMVGNFTYKDNHITPQSIGFDGAYRNTAVVAIGKDAIYGFDYYIIQTGDRNSVYITDFQEKWFPKFEARCQKEFGKPADPRNCLLYYLMHIRLDNDQKDNAETITYVLYDGYCLRATIDEVTEKYRLEPLVRSGELYGCGSGFAVDAFMYNMGYSKPIFEYIECPSCHHNWMFDESRIPAGEKYETPCPMCGTLLMRRKV